METEVRRIASNSDSLYVVTGTVTKEPLGYIGANHVAIPSAYYKTILAFNDGDTVPYAYYLKHEKSSAELNSFKVSIDELEELTGEDFFPYLNDEVERELEAIE